MPDESPFRVGVFPVPGFALMSYASTVEPLRAANLLTGRLLYDLVHFGLSEMTASSGAALVERRFDVGDTPDLDLLLVVAGGDPFAFDDASALAWLRRMARRVPRVGGVSGGPVILARAGLMEGRRMTVHWEHAPQLADAHPGAVIERRLFVVDRDRLTCGGGTAPMDLMLQLVGEQHGRGIARQVSDWFHHTEIRAAGAPQRGGVAERLGAHSPHVVDAVAAMESHVGDPLSLPQLALVAGVTPRHLNRLFRRAVGQSAMTYYRDLRLATGRRLAQSTAMTLAEVAAATGFSSVGHYSNAYARRFSVRPGADREVAGARR